MAAKAGASAVPDKVVSLFRRRPVGDGEPEIKIGLAPTSSPNDPAQAVASSALDLTGKPKVWFMVGGGNSGKTVEVRWLVGRMNEGGRQAVLAALDPANRSLASWFNGVEQPPSSDGVQTARWLREFLTFLMTEKQHSAVLDFCQ